MSSIGDCPEGAHGSIGDWDVSGVTKMGRIFSRAYAFNQDLSKWDVSAVTDMASMFRGVYAFNQDLSKWDVSAITNMGNMFLGASAFNQDLSKWDVSAVTNMRAMFEDASAFDRELCGAAWVDSKADRSEMFTNSPGGISFVACTPISPSVTPSYTEGEGYGCLGWGSSAPSCTGIHGENVHASTVCPTFNL